MQEPIDQLEAETHLQIEAALAQLRYSSDLGSDLISVLDIAIGITHADMGTLQRLDEGDGGLKLVASRGFSSQVLNFFRIVRRNTNTTCAAAFTRRMRVFVEDVSTSYLFVGTPELDMLTAEGIAAAQSTPLISSDSHLWGVLTTHFGAPQIESTFDHALLDQFALQVADTLVARESVEANPHCSGPSDGGRLT